VKVPRGGVLKQERAWTRAEQLNMFHFESYDKLSNVARKTLLSVPACQHKRGKQLFSINLFKKCKEQTLIIMLLHYDAVKNKIEQNKTKEQNRLRNVKAGGWSRAEASKFTAHGIRKTTCCWISVENYMGYGDGLGQT
jgi:hypothetical protein